MTDTETVWQLINSTGHRTDGVDTVEFELMSAGTIFHVLVVADKAMTNKDIITAMQASVNFLLRAMGLPMVNARDGTPEDVKGTLNG